MRKRRILLRKIHDLYSFGRFVRLDSLLNFLQIFPLFSCFFSPLLLIITFIYIVVFGFWKSVRHLSFSEWTTTTTITTTDPLKLAKRWLKDGQERVGHCYPFVMNRLEAASNTFQIVTITITIWNIIQKLTNVSFFFIYYYNYIDKKRKIVKRSRANKWQPNLSFFDISFRHIHKTRTSI